MLDLEVSKHQTVKWSKLSSFGFQQSLKLPYGSLQKFLTNWRISYSYNNFLDWFHLNCGIGRETNITATDVEHECMHAFRFFKHNLSNLNQDYDTWEKRHHTHFRTCYNVKKLKKKKNSTVGVPVCCYFGTISTPYTCTIRLKSSDFSIQSYWSKWLDCQIRRQRWLHHFLAPILALRVERAQFTLSYILLSFYVRWWPK